MPRQRKTAGAFVVWEAQPSRGAKKGSRGNAPCRVQGRRPCWGLGQRPNCSSSNLLKGKNQQRCRQRSVPASNFARPQTRPPSRSTQQLCCVAPNGRDQVAGLATIAALSRSAGISPLRRRVGGFAIAPDTPSQRTPMLLDFYRGFLIMTLLFPNIGISARKAFLCSRPRLFLRQRVNHRFGGIRVERRRAQLVGQTDFLEEARDVLMHAAN